ncbi:MAG: pentapeptide repeat-containing protein [Geitlerinemataceae cyanobacterium]
MEDLAHCYLLLGLEPGASLEDVNQAYKDLAFVWHPDRLPTDNLRLREKAQEKLKQINHARDLLRSHRPKSNTIWTPSPTRKASTPPRQKTSTQNRSTYNQPRSEFSGIDWQGASLKERDFSHRNLSGANLTGADLSDTFMHKTNLQGANLTRTNLFRANLFQADLREAILAEANLVGADFSGADLRGADLRGAKWGTATRRLVKLTGANLAGAIAPDGTIYPD